jgi:hypothetical protein
MKPLIDDEIYVDMEQEEERAQAELEPTGSEDPISTSSQPRISLAYPPDDTVDVFEGYSFDDRRPIVINEEEEAPRKDKEAGEDGETEAETNFGRNDLTKQTVLIKEALQSLTPSIQQRPPEPPPVYTDTKSPPFPTAALLAIPDIPTQVPASPPTPPTEVVGNAATAALAHHDHQTFKPKSFPRQRNFQHTRQEKTVVPVLEPDYRSSDEDEGEIEVDTNYGEGSDNCPRNIVNVDTGSHNGPRSIKTVRYHLPSSKHRTDETTISCQNVHFRRPRAQPA